MINQEFINHISTHLNQPVVSNRLLIKGKINTIYLIKTLKNNFVLKVNSASKLPGMFEAEKIGLNELSINKNIHVVQPLKTGSFYDSSFLILPHIEERKLTRQFWYKFGNQLNSLHQETNDKFGFTSNNYIGNIPQNNEPLDSWAEFYAIQRLDRQLKLAMEQGYLIGTSSKFEQLYNKLDGIFPKEQASLLHGDLWSGNFICGEDDTPWLIDPAVYYGHREMDIGMTLLFGGLDQLFYESYNSSNPLESDWKTRVPLAQLYPLLVHVNLFGESYINQVKSVLNKFV